MMDFFGLLTVHVGLPRTNTYPCQYPFHIFHAQIYFACWSYSSTLRIVFSSERLTDLYQTKQHCPSRLICIVTAKRIRRKCVHVIEFWNRKSWVALSCPSENYKYVQAFLQVWSRNLDYGRRDPPR
jgi:hypothetical protein